ncbi:MAG: PQQ-binding-like beta-propeller repeat protein [Thermoguttaceae bacterium]
MSPRLIVQITAICLGLALIGLVGVSSAGLLSLCRLGQSAHSGQSSHAIAGFPTEKRVPTPVFIQDNRGEEGPKFGELVRGPAQPTPTDQTVKTGSWPGFRGSDFSGIVHDSVPLARKFSSGGPKRLWSLELGEGYAGTAVRDGKVYILDYDTKRRRDTLRCLSLETGQEFWNYSYPVKIKRNHGMSRTMPAVSDKSCVTIGPKCHLMCVDPDSGELRWEIDLVEKYGTQVPQWYAGQCPLLLPKLAGHETASDVLILAPSGPDALLVAIDCANGQEIWRTPNPLGWVMTHTSIAPMLLGDRETFVYAGKGGVAGVDAKTGQLLWLTSEWSIGIATCPSPLVLPNNRVFLCGGYGAPSVIFEIQPQEGAELPYLAKMVQKSGSAVFSSEQQTPLLYKDHIFGIRQIGRKFVCMDLNGKVLWHSANKAEMGSRGAGPYLIADGMFFILSDEGTLTLAEATPEEFRKIASYDLFEDGIDAWSPLTLIDGYLLVRDLTRLYCLDFRKEAE